MSKSVAYLAVFIFLCLHLVNIAWPFVYLNEFTRGNKILIGLHVLCLFPCLPYVVGIYRSVSCLLVPFLCSVCYSNTIVIISLFMLNFNNLLIFEMGDAHVNSVIALWLVIVLANCCIFYVAWSFSLKMYEKPNNFYSEYAYRRFAGIYLLFEGLFRIINYNIFAGMMRA